MKQLLQGAILPFYARHCGRHWGFAPTFMIRCEAWHLGASPSHQCWDYCIIFYYWSQYPLLFRVPIIGQSIHYWSKHPMFWPFWGPSNSGIADRISCTSHLTSKTHTQQLRHWNWEYLLLNILFQFWIHWHCWEHCSDEITIKSATVTIGFK